MGAGSSGWASLALRHDGEGRWGGRGGPAQPSDPALITRCSGVPEESTLSHEG